MKNKNMTVINVRVPKKIVRQIDEESEKMGYPNRSEYIREAVIRMGESNLKEKVLEELVKRSIEARFDYMEHEEVRKKLRG